MSPHFLFGGALSDAWASILENALALQPKGPVVGTIFRQAVNEAASKAGLTYPLPEQPNLKFIDFLLGYPSVVSVVRRPGQDFLVVAAGEPVVLTQISEQPTFGIRRDLFEAFTKISTSMPYYDRAADSVTWLHDAHVAPSASLVRIPPPSLEGELKLRNDFISSLNEAMPAKTLLQEKLTSSYPIREFGKAIRALGLHREWHVFRTEKIQEQLQNWALENGIDWKGAWLTDKPTRLASPNTPGQLRITGADQVALMRLLGGLSEEDLRRISIPLDIVVRALGDS